MNRSWRLASRPTGLPTADDWSLSSDPVPEPADDEAVVAVQYISLDPAMRGWISDVPSYVPPVPIGNVMRAIGIGQVIESRSPAVTAGESVIGMFGVQEQAVVNARGLTKPDTTLAPAPVWLGTLGMTGLTAYFGIADIGKPVAGETVVVSGAGGAVGMVAGQLAKARGARVIGIAGGSAKCSYVLDDLGFDATIDYRSENVRRRLAALCPDGIDVYFDNVGGDVLDAVLGRLALHGRIVLCGAISQYNAGADVAGPRNYMALISRRASMTGFLITDYADRFGEGIAELAPMLADGRLQTREQIVEGIERFPEALNMLCAGENTGKLVLHVAPAGSG